MTSISVERLIIAPAEELFALVSDPRRHHEFDGSGTVQRTLDVSDDVVGLGTTFGMSMKMGVPYSMKNTIVEWEPGRRVAWRTEGGKAWMNRLLGGRVWRYEFEPRSDGTLVRETWDVSQEKFPLLVKPMAGSTRKNMAKTLERLAELTESG